MMITAVRETFEETGLWLGGSLQRRDERQARLFQDAGTTRELLAEAPVSAESLVLTSRWITPEGLPKRFDTWFFLAAAPEGVELMLQEREITDAVWIEPAEALRRQKEASMHMVFPTLRNLEAIAGFESAAEAIAARRGTKVEPVLPVLVNGKPVVR
jgi:hypothetical protein